MEIESHAGTNHLKIESDEGTNHLKIESGEETNHFEIVRLRFLYSAVLKQLTRLRGYGFDQGTSGLKAAMS